MGLKVKAKFKVGDRVVLNNIGLKGIHGLTSIEMLQDSQDLTITKVFDVNAMASGLNQANNPPIWLVEVDKPSINELSLMEIYFDLKV